MTTRRKVLKAVAWVAGVAGLAVVLGVAFAPRWINLEPVRARLEAAATSALGGAVTYRRVDLSWFPRPEVVLRDLEISAPGKVSGTVRAVGVSPALLPLLGGRVRLTRVAVDGPDLQVELPPTDQDETEPPGDPFLLLRSLVSEGRELSAELRDGRAVISRRGTTVADLSGFDLRVGIAARGPDTVRGTVTLVAPRVSLRRGERRSLEIDGLRVEGVVDFGKGRMEATLSRLSLGSPRVLVSGTYRSDRAAPSAELAVRGEGLDVTGARQKLLPFAGDVPTLAAVFAILRGGTLTSFSLAARGATPGDLGAFERMSIRAVLSGGSLRIDGAGLDFAAASGDASIEGGVLQAERVAANVGKSEARDGTLLVGLAGGDDRLRVSARVRADLAELPGILSRTMKDRAFLEELSLVEDLEGVAAGRITVEGRAPSLSTAVSVSEMRLSARYRRVPWPLRVDRGGFSFDGASVGLSGLAGSVGSSTLSGLEARVRLGGSPAIERLSGTLEASLAELHSGIASRDGMEPLRASVRQLTGHARVSVARLSGPFSRPQEWKLEATGTLRDLVLDASFLPARLEVSTGQIGIDPEAIRWTGLEARTLDAALRVSGTVRGYRERSRTVEATADGTVGPEGIRRLWQRAALPADLRPTAPIALRDVRLGIARPGALSLAGTFTAARGARVTLDLASDEKGIDVPGLTIADGDASASMSLRREAEALGVRFQGRLEGATVAKLLEGQPGAHGRIEGDFQALVPRERAGRPTSSGTLSVSDIQVPTAAGALTLERLDLRGAESRLAVSSSSLVLDGQRFSVAGSAAIGGDGIDLDLDVSTGDLAWPWVEGIVHRMERPEKAPTASAPEGTTGPAPSPPAIGGVFRVSLDSFRYGTLTWTPVLLDVRLDGRSATATVRKAELCGISTTGSARVLPGGTMEVEATVDSAGPDIGLPLGCLGIGDGRMAGRYEASVKASARGEPSQLLSTARGPLTFRATDGRLGKVGVLSRILGVLNATEVFAGTGEGRVGDAMPFRELSVLGELGDGAVSIREGTLDTPSFTMAASGRVGYLDGSLDLMVLSQPLSTLGKVVQAVPVVRKILGKDFLSVAAKVTGRVSDPKVKISPAKDVGVGLVHILERTVKLPVTVFDPPASPGPAPEKAPQ